MAAGQVKIKVLVGLSVTRCQLQALFPLYECGLETRKEASKRRKKTSGEVGAPPHRPLLEVGVISEVAQPGLPYRLSQFIMVSR